MGFTPLAEIEDADTATAAAVAADPERRGFVPLAEAQAAAPSATEPAQGFVPLAQAEPQPVEPD